MCQKRHENVQKADGSASLGYFRAFVDLKQIMSIHKP